MQTLYSLSKVTVNLKLLKNTFLVKSRIQPICNVPITIISVQVTIISTVV